MALFHTIFIIWMENLWWFLNHNNKVPIWLMKCVLFENRAQLLKRAKPTFQTSFSNFCTTDYFTWTSTQLFFDGHTLRMNCMYVCYGVIFEGTADKNIRLFNLSIYVLFSVYKVTKWFEIAIKSLVKSFFHKHA